MKNFKRLGTILMVVFMLMGEVNPVLASTPKPQEILGVKVYIEGAELETMASFYHFNNTTLVPMREFFQALGADLEWDGKTKTILARTDEKTIQLVIDQKTAQINEADHTLLVEPKIINNQTYVPLRFIAEALTYEVDWNPRDNIIFIMNTNEIKQKTMSKIYKSSEFFKEDYIKMEIIDNEFIKVVGSTALDKTDWLFIIEKDNGADVMKEYHKISPDDTYSHTFLLKNKLKEGNYKVSVYFKERNDKMYWSYHRNIPLSYEDGEIFFPSSPVYVDNYLAVIKASAVNPENYLEMATINGLERKAIIDLANTITRDASSDYEKLLKINDWVAENIYYNWDGYLKGTYGETDAYGTLVSKKSVCQGYAELTQELLRAVGIPAKLISGHALGVSASGRYWDAVDHEKSNHAWNEAFVDNRWVILDTTWNSANKYEGGTFKKAPMNYRYFDISLESFSFNHKILPAGR